jgi:hypothetical protein
MSSHPCFPVEVRSHYLANMSKSKHPARASRRYYGDYLLERLVLICGEAFDGLDAGALIRTESKLLCHDGWLLVPSATISSPIARFQRKS